MRNPLGEHFIQVFLGNFRCMHYHEDFQLKTVFESISLESYIYVEYSYLSKEKGVAGHTERRSEGRPVVGSDQFHLYIPIPLVNSSMYYFTIWKASHKKIKSLWQRQYYMLTKSPFLLPAYTRRLHFPASLALRLGLGNWVLTKETWAAVMYTPSRHDPHAYVIIHILSSSSMANF